MGLSKSKPRDKKGEEQRKGTADSVSRAKDKDREARQADREAPSPPADSPQPGPGPARNSRPSASSEEKPDTKQKSSKKKTTIPQIIVTQASNETIISSGSPGSEDQKTIREHADWGPYYRHRNPSTIAAYESTKE